MKSSQKQWKSFISVLVILFSLFFVVVFNMEIRRKGYELWSQLKKVQNLEDENRLKQSEYTKRVNDQMLYKLGTKNSLKPAKPGQIIHVKGKVIFKQ